MAPCRLSCQISANHCEAETSTNENKHWKTRAKGNDIITNVISANQHFALTFSMQIFNSRDVVASPPSFSRSATWAPRRACSQARQGFWYFAGFSGANSRKNRPILRDFRGRKIKIPRKIRQFRGILAEKSQISKDFRGKFLKKSADFTGNFGGKLRQETISQKQLILWIFFGKFR